MVTKNEKRDPTVPGTSGPPVRTFWIDTGKACGGIGVIGNKIVDAPPIWKGWIGRAFTSFVAYYKPTVKTL